MHTPIRMLVVMLVGLLVVACRSPTPTLGPPFAPTPSGPLNVTLTTDASSYSAASLNIHLTLLNNDEQPVYLAICEPWQILPEDEQQPVIMVLCEYDCLGHKVDPGSALADSVQWNLEPGRYRIQARAYGDCTLSTASPLESCFGGFNECAVSQEIFSGPFDITK